MSFPASPDADSVGAAPITLKRRSEFEALRNAPKAGARGFLLLKRRRGDESDAIRVGLTVTRKLGGAVVRNRIRRRLREVCRRTLGVHGEPGCDYVLIARSAAADRDFAALLDDLRRALITLRGRP